MKKSLLLLTTLLSFNISNLFATEAVELTSVTPTVNDLVAEPVSATAAATTAASATDLERIKTHILGYGQAMGLPDRVEVVGRSSCLPCCKTVFDATQAFLLNELAGQILTRFLAMALDDAADGRLDGIAHGKKISYALEIGQLLGVPINESELRSAPVDPSLLTRLVGLGTDIAIIIQENADQKEKIVAALRAVAQKKMDRARKSLAVALIHEADRIIALELGNGVIDGLDASGKAINWKTEIKTSVERALGHVLYGVL